MTKMKAKAVRPASREVDLEEVQHKFATTARELKRDLVERDDEIDMCLTALLANQHSLLIGPPGTAKSMLAAVLANWLVGGRSFTVHCCKDTSRSMAFGPVKLSALKEDRSDRNLEGGAADCHFLVLEEVYKSGPAVLDMFLMLMNEREYVEGLVRRKAPLRQIIGVSNEWSPEGCEAALSAFFDRFLFRKEVKPIASDDGLQKLCGIWVEGLSSRFDCTPKLSTNLELGELDAANEAVRRFEFSKDAHETFFKIHKALKDEGIVAGDRRLKQSVLACQAAAFLDGANRVQPEHLEILAHTLWSAPEQAIKAERIVAKMANPLLHKISELRGQATSVFKPVTDGGIRPAQLDDIHSKLAEIRDNIRVLDRHHKRDAAVAYVEELIRKTLRAVHGLKG